MLDALAGAPGAADGIAAFFTLPLKCAAGFALARGAFRQQFADRLYDDLYDNFSFRFMYMYIAEANLFLRPLRPLQSAVSTALAGGCRCR